VRLLVLLIASTLFASEVYFSPKGGCTSAVVSQIDNAKSYILIQAYGFTSEKIILAVKNAVDRNVSVKLFLDRTNRNNKKIQDLNATICIDNKFAIAHNKVMVIDGDTLITGSFNFTESAEKRNAENLLILNDKELIQKYIINFNEHFKECD
jgi:phosphatidylserine/phosphatidylglycerophosphate/cardiolipin synthase-like enzyme